MESKKEAFRSSIASRLLLFFQRNREDSKSNRHNGSLSAEDFMASLFNLLYKNDNQNYINVNKISQNFPGIDLLDSQAKQAVQVTVSNNLKKIKDTFETVPTIESNKDYEEIIFFIQDTRITAGMKSFGPEHEGYRVKVKSVTDLLREIDMVDDDHLEEICKLVEQSIDMPAKMTEEQDVDVDVEVFNLLFRVLKDKVDTMSDDEQSVAYKSSPTEKKKKFEGSWDDLVQLYTASLGLSGDNHAISRFKNYETNVREVFSQDLDEGEKDAIQKYLNTQSMLILRENGEDPVVSIGKLTDQIRKDLNLEFVPTTHILSFVLNMFFKCDVFPLIKTNHE